MNTNPPPSEADNAVSYGWLKMCLGLALLLQSAGSAMAQLPAWVSVDASSRANADLSWGTNMNNYTQSTIVQATATVTRSGTTVSGFTITNRGANYAPPPAEPPIVRITGGNGTGATAVATIGPDGKLATLTVTNGGTGYTGTPVVEIATGPGGVGSSIRFNVDITANRIITLDGNRTVGRMILGDLNTSSRYTIDQGTGGSLIFDNAGNGGGAFFSKFTGNLDTINAPIVLNDRLNFRVTTNRLVLNGEITGNGNTITSYGNGVLEINGNNTNSNFNLVLWNKGAGNANPQVQLGATVGNAVSGDVTIGNASRGTAGHAVLQLLQGRSNLDQISDSATVTFDSYSTSGRNNYFKLMGGNETVGRIVDLGGRAIIENREGESVNTRATLTLVGAGDSYVSGFIRDNTGAATAQADADGTPGNNALGLAMNGAGTLYLSGANIAFTGGMSIGADSTVSMRQVTNFRSDITNNGTLIFDTGTLGATGVWNFRKAYLAANDLDPVNLLISGNGSVVKTGQAILNLGGTWNSTTNQKLSHSIGGTLTVKNGTLNLSGIGDAGSLGTYIGGGLVAEGDSGLARNINLLGKTMIDSGGINATGRFQQTNSVIRVQGTVFSNGDQEPSFVQPGVLTINGGSSIRLNYMDLRLGGATTVAKTTTGSSSSVSRVTVTDSSSIAVGMRLVSNSGSIPANTVVTAIDPVTRVVTLSNNVTVPSGSAVSFIYESHTSGVINSGSGGGLQNITLIGRPSPIGAASINGGLYLENSQYSNNTNRVPDTAQITMKGGQIEFINDATRNVFSERLGGVTLEEGNSQIIAYRSAAGTGSSSTLTLSSLSRFYGTTVEFGSRQLLDGANTNTTTTLGTDVRSRILIDGGVTLDDGIIGGWAHAGFDFVKYHPTNGVTPLVLADYQTATPNLTATTRSNTWSHTSNILIGAEGQLTTMAVAGKVAVNSLNLKAFTDTASARAVTLSAGAILSIETGGLLSSNGNNTITGSGNTGYVTVGSAKNTPAELMVTVGTTRGTTGVNTLTMNSAIRDFNFTQTAAGITMAANSDIMTVPANLYALLMVGMEVTHTNLPGGTTILAINRSNSSGTTIQLSNAATAAVTSTVANPVSFKGGSVGLTKSGPGNLLLSPTLEYDYTGPTIINNGLLSLRANGNLGEAPSTFVSDHLQLNGGTLQFRREQINGVVADQGNAVPNYGFNFTEGNRGIYVGESGGRLEVGHVNPTGRYTLNAAQTATLAQPILNVSITNAIDAYGVLELAVRGSPTLGTPVFNTLTLGTVSSSNQYRGGIKTEGTYEGIITINGNNFINGLFLEGARVTIAHDNDFSSTMRIVGGQLTLNGSNTYNGQPNFTETIVVGAANATGLLTLGSDTALGTGGFKISLGSSSELRLFGTDQTLLSLSGQGNSIISNGYSRPAGTGTDMNRTSTLTVDLPVNETFSGFINNGGTSALELVKIGAGRLDLTNNGSNFSGNVRILEGVVNVTTIARTGFSSALGRGTTGAASEILIDGGALSFTPVNLQITNRSFTMGAGTDAATLVALGTTQAARVILGVDSTVNPGAANENRIVSAPVGFVGDGARTLTLSGVNLGDNEFRLQLSDKSISEPTSLLKIGSGAWALGAASNYSGQTTVQDGVLALLTNNAAGTSAIATTVNVTTDTFTGNMPNGVEVSFPRFVGTRLPGGITWDRRYYVVQSNSTDMTFKVSTERGPDATPIDLFTLPAGPPANVSFVPNIQTQASTVASAATKRFTGNLPNGTAVVFGYQLLLRNLVSDSAITSALPGGILPTETYYVINATGEDFEVSTTPGGARVEFTSNSVGPIYYQASLVGNTSDGIFLVGGRLELRNVDYMTPETITFQGGALALPQNTVSRWTGNWDVQANSTLTIAAGAELIMDGNLLGTRQITQLGEGTIRLRGEAIMPTQPGMASTAAGAEGENVTRRVYSLQAGTLILDYTLNNNAKLVDRSALVLGGGRRGGELILQGGSHEEVVLGTTLATGASSISRVNDGGTSTIRLNTITRQLGSSLYFDLARIASVNNLNSNGILGGWAIIRDAVTPATRVITGTVSRNFTADALSDVMAVPTPDPFNPVLAAHYLVDGTPVRLTTTGTLPAPLVAGQTYYVTAAGTTTFKLSLTPFGVPVDLQDAGSPGTDQHTVTTYQPQRTSPASLLFTVNQSAFPGAMGNNIFSVEIAHNNVTGPITHTQTGSLPTPQNPNNQVIVRIVTTNNNNTATAIRNYVNFNVFLANYFTVQISTNDATEDTSSVPAGFLGGGQNDNGGQGLSWATNSTNVADGMVQVYTGFTNSVWGRGLNTDVIPTLVNDQFAEIDPTGNVTYTLRYAANAPSVVNLSRNELYTLETGAILISPTVGQNDTSLIGAGTLTTENSGNLGSFLIHQYNEAADFVLGVDLVNRAEVIRIGRLTSGNRRILSAVDFSKSSPALPVEGPEFLIDATVSGTGIPAGTVVTEVIEYGLVLNNEATNGDNRTELVFTKGGTQYRLFATQQSLTSQNRINGVMNEAGEISTADIYLGMPVVGPGIPAGALVDFIPNDSDIRINTNHFNNGIMSTFRMVPTLMLEKLGGGTLVLNGNNRYTGVTFLADGVIRAMKLTDGGVAGSLGAATAANANINFNGGTLQYTGENTSTNRGFTISDFATINIGHEKTTAVFSGGISLSGTIGAADRLEKTGSGTLEMRGTGSLNELSVQEGKLLIQIVNLNALPQTTTASSLAVNGLASVRLGGGTLEVRGLPEADATQNFGGTLYVDEGSSTVRAISVQGFNSNNLSVGNLPRSTNIILMGGEETASVARSSGGTVLFVEAPEANSGSSSIFLQTASAQRATILPWAVYEDGMNVSRPGVNDFAVVSLVTGAVLASDLLQLHQINDQVMNANNWGVTDPGAFVNASEGGIFAVNLFSGVSTTAGSNLMVVSSAQAANFNQIVVGMRVSGMGIDADTTVVALNKTSYVITLSKPVTVTSTTGSYFFQQERAFFGTIGSNDPGNLSHGVNRSVNTLRYASGTDSTIEISEGSTLSFVSGAILVGSSTRGGTKSIMGGGNITSQSAAGEGTDFIVHNYNPITPFTIGANIVDSVLLSQLVSGGTPVSVGTVVAGQAVLTLPEQAFDLIGLLHVGMEVSGPGIPAGTKVTGKELNQIFLSNAATSSGSGLLFSFRSTTSFVQSGTGTTILSGDNLYTGTTFVHGGVLRLDSAKAVPGGITAGAPLATSSHLVVKGGVIGLGHENFTRSLGTADNQVEFKGSGGFAAYGADRLVDFGGEGAGKRLRYGNDGFVEDGSSLILGATDATHKVTLVNSLDLGSFTQAVRVENGPAEIEGELSGTLSGLGKLIKFGLGSLRLSGSNTHTGGIEVADGRLVLANVPNVMGQGDGAVSLGTSQTNTSAGAAIELTVEGGTLTQDIVVGGVNSRTGDWVERGTAGGSTGSQSSMILVNGNPAIAYYDPVDRNLKFVRATDARGTTWLPPVTVADRGDVGQFPSLAIINNNPAITYYDATNGMLCFVRSTDISGVDWGVPVIVDSDPVSALGVQSTGKVIIGGTFLEFDGSPRTRLARLMPTGALDTTFTAEVNGEIRDIAVLSDDSVVIAGAFTEVNGSARNRIARLSAEGALMAYNPNANGAINVLVLLPGDNLLVGGAFTSIGGASRNRLARLQASGAADTSFNANVNGEVMAVTVQADNSILLGGSFTAVAGTERNRIARVTTTGALEAFNPNANGVVRAIVVQGDKIYVGGAFATMTGTGTTTTVTRNRLARLEMDGTVDKSYAIEVNAEVRGMALLASSNKIALYGIFTQISHTTANYLARLNEDGSLDTGYVPNPNQEVMDILEQPDGKLLIGGLFSRVSGATQHFAGRLNADGTADLGFNRKVNNRGMYSSLAPVAAFPSVSYYDATTGQIRYNRATNINGTVWGQSLSILSGTNQGRASVLRIANIGGDLVVKNTTNGTVTASNTRALNGTPAVAYHDPAGNQLMYVLSNDALGTDWSAPVVVDTTGNVGSHLSMELVNGFPAIAYYNESAGALQYVRAVNSAGLTNNLRAPDGTPNSIPINNLDFQPAWSARQTLDSGNVGQYPSLAVLKDKSVLAVNTPAVAYYDAANGNLKYVRANNTTGVGAGSPFVPAWGTPQTVVSDGDVGSYANMVITEGLPGMSYYDADADTLKFVHFSDATGYSKLTFEADTIMDGALDLQGMALLAPDLGQILTINGALTGNGGFRLISEGSVLINSENNDFGGGFGPGEAPVVVRTGSLLLGSSTALGSNRVDLGDRAGNPRPFNADNTVSAHRATAGSQMTAGGGRFDLDHNGLVDNAGGRGAFVNVASTIDGRVYTSADVGRRILVKDETANPERNGIYRVVFAAAQPAGTMNLVRTNDLDELAEFIYGLQVEVTEGSSAGRAYFLTSLVQDVNSSPVIWSEVLTAERATTGASLTAISGSFDPFHNGLFGNAGGPGAFVEVDTEIDGRTFSRDDEGTLILVKDETNTNWNGLYRIQYGSGIQRDGTMNLVRAEVMDEVAEFSYGLQVRVSGGTSAGHAYFLASEVLEMNISPVLWVRDVPDGDLALRVNVSGLTIANNIDLNRRIGAGSTTIGSVSALTSGTADFTGAITLRDNNAALAERLALNLDSGILTGYGVNVTGLISEQRGTSSSGAPADVLSLVKTGAGVATLRAANTFNGGVTVNEGTLLVMNTTGSATGTGQVTVNAGAVLGGTGRIAGPVVLNGTGTGLDTRATLRVGDPNSISPVEILTINNTVTVGANSVIEFTLGVDNITRLVANTVELTPTGRLLVAFAEGFTPAPMQAFDIFDGTINFTAGSGAILSEYLKLPGAYTWDISTFATTGIVSITGETVPVQITTQPQAPAAALNPGQSLTLTVAVSGSPQFQYQWQQRVAGGEFVNVGPVARDTDATSNSLVFSSIIEANQGEYRVLVSNRDGFGQAVSNIVFVDVNDPPLITQQPRVLNVTPEQPGLNPGETATITVQAVTPPGLDMTYQWRRGATLLNGLPRYSGAQTDTLTITDLVEADESANYNVVITNAAGATVSNFVTLTVNNPITITSQPRDTTVNDGESATFAVTVSSISTQPVQYQWQWNRGVEGGGFVDIVPADIGGGSATSRTLTIPNLTLGDSGFSVRVLAWNVVGEEMSTSATLTVKEGTGVPTMLDQPASQTVLVGDTVQMVVRVGGSPQGRSIQWKRGRANVRLGDIKSAGMVSNVSVVEEQVGQTTRSILTITNISQALMGEYSAVALNGEIAKAKDAISSDVALLAVVSNNPEAVITVQGNGKEKAVMNVTVRAPKSAEITYHWMKDGDLLEADSLEGARFTGINGPRLTITQVEPEDRGVYTVMVIGPGDEDLRMVIGGTHELKVYTEAPELLPISFPPAMVGAYFEYQIPVNFGPNGEKSPVTYRATGLPPGLKVNSKTGWIRGVPTVAITRIVTISAINKIKPAATTAPNNPQLVVQPVPEGAVGVFAGWIQRDEQNDDVGGRFDLKTTVRGAFTGKVTIGLKAYPFKGALNLTPANPTGPAPAPPSATVTVLRKGKPVQTPMTLTFVMNPQLDRLASASLTDETGTVSFSAWRHVWSKLNNVPTPYMGYHTFALMPPDPPDTPDTPGDPDAGTPDASKWPMGDSFGYFTVRDDGKLSTVVKMADGQAFTSAQFLGPLGEILFYKVLYKTTPRGSVVGQIRLNKNDDSVFADNSISSVPATAPTWWRPADPAAPATKDIYSDGFDSIITLTAVGGAYEDPNRAWPDPEVNPGYPLLLGIPNNLDEEGNDANQNNVDNASIAFTTYSIKHVGGSPNLPTRYTDVDPWVLSTNAIDVITGSKVIVPTPGSRDNPYQTRLTVTPKTGLFRGTTVLERWGEGDLTARKVTYQGIIVLTNEGLRGVGYYLAPNDYPRPGGPNVRTLPQISNQVYFGPYTPPEEDPEDEPTP